MLGLEGVGRVRELGEKKRRLLGLEGVRRKQEQEFMNVFQSPVARRFLNFRLEQGRDISEFRVDRFVCLSVSAIFLSHILQTSLPNSLQRQFLWCGNSTPSTSLVLKPFVG